MENPERKPRKPKAGGRPEGQCNRRDLTDRQVQAAKHDVRCSRNLWLQVHPSGARSFFCEVVIAGKGRTKIGLGAYPATTLAKARERTIDIVRIAKAGGDPRKPAECHIFSDVADLYVARKIPEWRNPKYAIQTPQEIHRYCDTLIGSMDIAKIDTPDVEAVLMQPTPDGPLWLARTKLAVRLRGFMEKILGYGIAKKWRSGPNPARWEDNLEMLLASASKIHTDAPHPSMRHVEIAAFMAVLRSMSGMEYRALELLIHCAGRTRMVFEARWPEFDMAALTWTVPPIRMKIKGCKFPHVMPLTPPMVALLEALPRDGSDLVFGKLNDKSLDKALKATVAASGREWLDATSGLPAVNHGFRSSFATWAGGQGVDENIINVAIAHAVGEALYRRYMRSDMLDLRRAVMAEWSAVLAG